MIGILCRKFKNYKKMALYNKYNPKILDNLDKFVIKVSRKPMQKRDQLLLS